MPVLALDTSADITVVLVDPVHQTVLAERRVTEQRRHAELLAPLVVAVLAEGGVDRRELTAVVVGTGPAPFTGLRAGLVTARTLAFALGVPVRGVCSLDVLAAQAFDAGTASAASTADAAEVVVVTDARRREVYVARYRRGVDGDVVPVGGPAVLHPADLAAELAAAPAVVVGAGAGLYPEHLVTAPGAPLALDGGLMVRLAQLRAARGEAMPTEPLYLRRPDVTPSLRTKRATG